MSKTITDEQIAHAGLSETEIAALEETEAEGKGEDESKAAATDDKKSDGGSADKADSEKGVLPQTTLEEAAGTAADLKPDADAKAKADDDKAAEKPADKTGGADDEVSAAAGTENTDDDKTAPAGQPMVDSFRAQLAARGLPEDYEQQLTDTNEAVEALDKKLEDGDIEYAAHAKENRALSTKLADLTAIKREAEFVAGNNDLIADQHWQWEVERFTEENPQFQNPVVYGALRGGLEELYALEENAGRSYRWFLQQAAKAVSEAFDIAKPKADKVGDDDKTPAADQTAEQIKAELDDKEQKPPPQTLADIPASDADKETKDEFSSLDSLDGMDLEAALSKMPKAEMDKYLDSRNY
jgi:hypothetical protein